MNKSFVYLVQWQYVHIFLKSLVTPMTAFCNNLELSAPNLHWRDAPTVKPSQCTDFFNSGERILHLYTVTGKLVLRRGLDH